jgi:hypothetical protein
MSPFYTSKTTKYELLQIENYKDFKTFANHRGEVITQGNPLEWTIQIQIKVIISGPNNRFDTQGQ